VIAVRQFHSQFGRDHAAAAVGRITGDADFHARSFRLIACGVSLMLWIFVMVPQIRWPFGSRDSDFDWQHGLGEIG
jgi:hypothetical protein